VKRIFVVITVLALILCNLPSAALASYSTTDIDAYTKYQLEVLSRGLCEITID